jgi:hypothetical protein
MMMRPHAHLIDVSTTKDRWGRAYCTFDLS